MSTPDHTNITPTYSRTALSWAVIFGPGWAKPTLTRVSDHIPMFLRLLRAALLFTKSTCTAERHSQQAPGGRYLLVVLDHLLRCRHSLLLISVIAAIPSLSATHTSTLDRDPL